MNPIQRINRLGQSIWCDSISRSMIESGELRRLIDIGITGMTSNPTIFHKAIAHSTDYDERIQSLSAEGKSVEEVYEALAIEDIADAADLLRPVYDRTNARDGFISLEVSPHLAHDTEGTVVQARSLWGRVDRPNLMIKVPGTQAGLPAIRTLLSEGINVNVTLIFALDLYDKVMQAFLDGVTELGKRGGDVTRIASVASFFVSRVDTLADKKLQQKIDGGRKELRDLLGRAAIGNATMAYQRFKSVFDGPRFAELRRRGAAVQRPLWASTSTKNPNYPDTYYVDNLIGPDTVNTIPLDTIGAVHDHATPALTIDSRLSDYVTSITRIETASVSMSDVTDELLAAGVSAFADSFDHLLADIRTKIAALQAV
ncbi:MAG: transaldolase [Phycisphaerales bacterium]|nr:transaldolase [Phycisphaerales bacterium]